MVSSEFGKNVKKKLIEIDKTQDWLINQVIQTTGQYCDSAYMSKILSGKHKPPKIIQAIKKILELPN